VSYQENKAKANDFNQFFSNFTLSENGRPTESFDWLNSPSNLINLAASSSSSPQAATTPDSLSSALLSGSKWILPTNRTLTYSFYEDDIFGGSYYGGETGVREVSEAIKSEQQNGIKRF
jgi:serralysin